MNTTTTPTPDHLRKITAALTFLKTYQPSYTKLRGAAAWAALCSAVAQWRREHPNLDEVAWQHLLRLATEHKWRTQLDKELVTTLRFDRLHHIRDPDAFRGFPTSAGTITMRELTLRVDDILGTLVDVSPGPPPALRSISTYPLAEAPDLVAVNVPFELIVGLRDTPPTPVAHHVELARTDHQPVVLDVEVVLPRGAVESDVPLRGQLQVGESGRSAELRFTLVARLEGVHDLSVRFHRAAVTICRLTLEVRAQRAGASLGEIGTQRSADRLSASIGLPSGGHTLLVQREPSIGDRRYVRQRLLAVDGKGQVLEPDVGNIQPLGPSTEARIVELCRRFGRLFENTSAAAQRESRLRGIGAELAQELLHRDVVTRLHALPDGTPLHIEDDDAWVPWELLYLQRGSVGFFLGERFAVTRGLPCSRLVTRIPRLSGVLMAPATGLDPSLERESLREICDSLIEMRTLGQMQSLLEGTAGNHDILHFVCHGRHTPELAGEEYVLGLNDHASLLRSDVRSHIDDGSPGPLDSALVFINACQAGIGGPRTPAGQGGWAEAFLCHGVGAVIAPAWTILDEVARTLAARLYAMAAEGYPLPEALRRARIAVREEGQPDRLAYALYSHPQASLAMERERRVA